MQRRAFIAGLALGSVATTLPVFAQEGTTMSGSLNPDAVAKLDAAMKAIVTDGKVPGVTWLIARGDNVASGSAGTFEFGAGAPMARDTIFRIASITKPITATAMMLLVEEGRIDLDAPVETYLPELKDRRVLTALDAPLDSTVPAERSILVRDLLTFTLGFGIQFDPSLPIQSALVENQMTNDYPLPMTPHTPDEWLRRFAELPLMAQPGATWLYNTGSLLQGILIHRVSGQTLDDFYRTRIFEPLGMVDTAFWVPEDKLHRLPAYYGANWETGEVRMEDPAAGAWSKPQPFPSPSGGLVSTVDDLLRFARMMMQKGVHEGQQFLSAASVAAMTTDQLTPAQKEGAGFGPGFFDTLGWGYGMAVTTAPSPLGPNAGRYGWDGGFSCSWANDPTSGLIGIMLTQNSAYYAEAPFLAFWDPANAAAA